MHQSQMPLTISKLSINSWSVIYFSFWPLLMTYLLPMKYGVKSFFDRILSLLTFKLIPEIPFAIRKIEVILKTNHYKIRWKPASVSWPLESGKTKVWFVIWFVTLPSNKSFQINGELNSATLNLKSRLSTSPSGALQNESQSKISKSLDRTNVQSFQ